MVFALFQIVSVSFPPPPFVRRTVTVVEAPVQVARIRFGSIGSLKVNVAASPASALPAVAPPFAVWMSDAVGTVLSRVALNPF